MDTTNMTKGKFVIVLAAMATFVLPALPLAAPAEVTPSPETLLREMSEELKNAGSFQFHAEINFDDVLISGQKLQYAGAADVTGVQGVRVLEY